MLKSAETFLYSKGYFDFVEQSIEPNLVLEARNIYEDKLRNESQQFGAESVYIDKLPLNLIEVPLIQQLFPNAKFILALRHPMDAILSCWMQNFKLNPAMANMVDLNRIVDFYCIAMEIFKICRTDFNLNVHEIRYEDLISNFQSETEDVLAFLNLKWESQMANYLDDALNERIRTPSYSQVIQPIYTDAQYRWVNYRKYLDQYLDKVQPWLTRYKYS